MGFEWEGRIQMVVDAAFWMQPWAVASGAFETFTVYVGSLAIN